jgi:hypothetical protein
MSPCFPLPSLFFLRKGCLKVRTMVLLRCTAISDGFPVILHGSTLVPMDIFVFPCVPVDFRTVLSARGVPGVFLNMFVCFSLSLRAALPMLGGPAPPVFFRWCSSCAPVVVRAFLLWFRWVLFGCCACWCISGQFLLVQCVAFLWSPGGFLVFPASFIPLRFDREHSQRPRSPALRTYEWARVSPLQN